MQKLSNEGAHELATEWVASHWATKSKASDLIRTRAHIKKMRIVDAVADQSSEFADEFYSAVEQLLLEGPL